MPHVMSEHVQGVRPDVPVTVTLTTSGYRRQLIRRNPAVAEKGLHVSLSVPTGALVDHRGESLDDAALEHPNRRRAEWTNSRSV